MTWMRNLPGNRDIKEKSNQTIRNEQFSMSDKKKYSEKL